MFLFKIQSGATLHTSNKRAGFAEKKRQCQWVCKRALKASFPHVIPLNLQIPTITIYLLFVTIFRYFSLKQTALLDDFKALQENLNCV